MIKIRAIKSSDNTLLGKQVVTAWLSSKENIVSESYIGHSLDEVETQLKKLQDFNQSLKAQENKIGGILVFLLYLI